MKKFLAFDIGGTKIAYAVVAENGKLQTERQKIETPKTKDDIYRCLEEIVRQYEPEIDAVAIATAGAVSLDNKRIVSSVGNMAPGYRDIDFQSLSSKPVYLENDANAVAWAEYKTGAGKGYNNVIVIAIGTGLGLGVIADGHLFKGKSGAGTEAHFSINRGQKRLCSCGAYDCYEIYASGTALGLDAKEAFGDEHMTSYDLIRLMREGNPKAKEVFDMWQNDILSGIIGFANLFDPDMIVLFGSLVEYIEVGKLEKEANKQLVSSPFLLRKADNGHNAAMIGAALIAADYVNGNRK
ncbi:MAG: ROK family protein [Alphaproteobacteria bacterium]